MTTMRAVQITKPGAKSRNSKQTNTKARNGTSTHKSSGLRCLPQ